MKSIIELALVHYLWDVNGLRRGGKALGNAVLAFTALSLVFWWPLLFWVSVAGNVIVLLKLIYAHHSHGPLDDIPMSRIRSAAAGIIKVQGRARRMPGTEPTLSPVTGLPCLWWRVETFDVGSDGVRDFQGVRCSENTFALEDQGHWLVINPFEADVQIDQMQTFKDALQSRNEWVILENDKLLVVGDCRAINNEGLLVEDARMGKMIQLPEDDDLPYLISNISAEQLLGAIRWRITAHAFALCILALLIGKTL